MGAEQATSRCALVALLASLAVSLATDEASAQVYAPIGDEISLHEHPAGSAVWTAIDHLHDGAWVAVWDGRGRDEDASTAGVLGRRFEARGRPLGAELRANVGDPTGRSFSVPEVAASADGAFLVAWKDTGRDVPGGPRHTQVRARLFDPQGVAVGVEIPVSTTTTQFTESPVVAPMGDGGFIVLWHEGLFEFYEQEVWARRLGADGVPLAGAFRVDVGTPYPKRDAPSVAARPEGGFTVVWDETYVSQRVVARRLDALGQPSGFPVEVQAPFYEGRDPEVAHAVDGGGLAVFRVYGSPTAGGEGIEARLLASDGAPAGGQFRVNQRPLDQGGRPDVCALADGGYLVVWEAGGPSWGADVHALAVDATGAVRGAELVVNALRSGRQQWPRVPARCGAEPWVVWFGEPDAPAPSWQAHARRLRAWTATFADGFELGDTSGWSFAIPIGSR